MKSTENSEVDQALHCVFATYACNGSMILFRALELACSNVIVPSFYIPGCHALCALINVHVTIVTPACSGNHSFHSTFQLKNTYFSQVGLECRQP